VVVSKDGYILTKASEIEGVDKLLARVDKESYDEVQVVAVDAKWDVALIKVDAQDLSPAEFAPDSKLEQGSWVVVNGATSRTKRRVLAGIISAMAREIPTAGGAAMGISITDAKDKLEVKEVTEGGGAAVAGILAGDLILEVDGKKVVKIEELSEILKDKKAGDDVKVTVKRAGKNMDLNVKLTARSEMFLQPDRNDQMSGDFSKRRSGFPRVIQHDILANSETMGGPVLDMKGRVVGMNIARANRAETFAIPVEELQVIAKQMVEAAGQ
jgi:S1-C subfamily serine protease